MKNKIGFIMPRLVGATVVAGVAALVVTTLFKLLLGLTVIAGVATLVVRAIGKQYTRQLHYGQGGMPAFKNRGAFGNTAASGNSINPVAGFAGKKETTIVPIN